MALLADEDAAPRPSEWWYAPWSAAWLGALAWLSTVDATQLLVSSGLPSAHAIFAFLILCACAFCLWRSFHTTSAWRIWYGVVLAVSILFSILPLGIHFFLAGDLPWSLIASAFLALGVACWFAHQRWLIVALPVCLGLALHGAFLPRHQPGPVSKKKWATTVTIESLHHDHAEFTIADASGRPPFALTSRLIHFQPSVTAFLRPHEPFVAQQGSTPEFRCPLNLPKWASAADVEVSFTLPRDYVHGQFRLGPGGKRFDQLSKTVSDLTIRDSRVRRRENGEVKSIELIFRETPAVLLADVRLFDDNGRPLGFRIDDSKTVDRELTVLLTFPEPIPASTPLNLVVTAQTEEEPLPLHFSFEGVPIQRN